MRCSRVEEMQERTVTSEIEIRGKDVFGLFAGPRGVRRQAANPAVPAPDGFQTIERVAHDACLNAVVESHDGQETGQEDTSRRAPNAVPQRRSTTSTVPSPSKTMPVMAFRIQVAGGCPGVETLVEARYLAS